MKKVMFTLGIGVLSILGTHATVNASETTTEATTDTSVTTEASDGVGTTDSVDIDLKDGGITPDSALYGLDKLFEEISLKLTFDEEKQAQKLLEIAEERLGELQDLDEDSVAEFADELYEEYGVRLETANETLSKLIAEGKIDDDDLAEIQDKLGHASDAELAVDENKKEAINEEIKNKIKDVQTKSYAVSVATGLEEDQVSKLKEEGFGYGEILKLTAFANMSGMTVEELIYLDIFEENEDGEVEVDFGKLAEELGIDKDDVKDQFKAYKDVVKQTRKSQRDNKNDKDASDDKNEKEEFEKKLNEKVSAIVSKHKDEFLAKIDEVYNARLKTIEGLTISEEKKTELINELDEIKIDLIEEVKQKVEDHELNPRDFGELNREITKEFNEVLDDLDLTDEEKEEIRDASEDIEKQANNLVDQVVKRIEKRTNRTIDQSIIDKIKSDVLETARENSDEDVSELLGDIQEKIFERLGEVERGHRGNSDSDEDDVDTDQDDGDTEDVDTDQEDDDTEEADTDQDSRGKGDEYARDGENRRDDNTDETNTEDSNDNETTTDSEDTETDTTV
ncbi:DUF5667 domain-containing protein [Haloplasma contractile]|uniref:DUF5667 domain-containing protein n=1 Tax=Haloplasma contractile SSD-17B TaxID=1033810 RepID=U2DSI5_9MOLU|nr:DUF5667 domain-containing protein [Haloplasma contractile]ERJ11482.1 hypothetical protein HLPCO_002394 [Haloplasma contractile SSD-17B]